MTNIDKFTFYLNTICLDALDLSVSEIQGR